MSNLIDHSVTPTTRDAEVASEAFAGSLSDLVESLGAHKRFGAVASLARVIASVRVHSFREAKRLAMEECDKYVARFKKASEATDDIQLQFAYRDMIRAAESCKGWIETIKEPA